MTDYNDGKLHRWNGDGYPDGVHPESLIWCQWIDMFYGDQGIYQRKKADRVPWSQVTAFRVVEVYEQKPREYWLCKTRAMQRLAVYEEPPWGSEFEGGEIIHVREVIE